MESGTLVRAFFLAIHRLGNTMQTRTSRRSAIAAVGAGAAGIASFSLLPRAAMAAISSSAGIVAGGSLEGPNGPIQFSAFGSRIQLDDADDLVFQGALA